MSPVAAGRTTRTSAPLPRPVRATTETLELRISDPISLLNEIARRYESPQRILLEYVDNAIDDMEAAYRDNAEAYPQDVRIEIIVDAAARTVTVRDNCRGMLPATLARIVVNVGESRKKGLTWVNGQFGFGVHAFRASARRIHIATCHVSGVYSELTLERDQMTGIAAPTATRGRLRTNTGTGTEVVIGPFDEEAMSTLTADAIKAEIEYHFERLLARPRLQIVVSDTTGMTRTCAPYAYEALGGVSVARTLLVERDGQRYPVDVYLAVSPVPVAGRTARFFARGRRINEVSDIKSFLRRSDARGAVWGHPHLLGYIEVGELARPVITRDDFDRGGGRTALYEALVELEGELSDALAQVNDTQRDTTLTRLEDVMRTVLNELAREDKLRLRSTLVPGQDTGRQAAGGAGSDDAGRPAGVGVRSEQGGGLGGGTEEGNGPVGPDDATAGNRAGDAGGDGGDVVEDPSAAEGRRQPQAGFNISFGEYPPDADGQVVRSRLTDGTIYLNSAHPDFVERISFSRAGRPRFTDRLGAYLAATTAIHYKDMFYARYGRQPERRDQLFDEMVAFSCRLESALRPHLPRLQAEYAGHPSATE